MAIKTNLKSTNPTGTFAYYGGEAASIPLDYLYCDGTEVLISSYPQLYAKIGDKYGTPVGGPLYFKLPDSRGWFLRGTDNGAGVDPGRIVGSYQMDDFRSHTHNVDLYGSAGGDGGFADPNKISSTDQGLAFPNAAGSIKTTGGLETRPRNLAVTIIIKT